MTSLIIFSTMVQTDLVKLGIVVNKFLTLDNRIIYVMLFYVVLVKLCHLVDTVPSVLGGS